MIATREFRKLLGDAAPLPPARVNVNRCALDALLCDRRANPDGHRGVWGVARDVADAGRLVPGRLVQFVMYGGGVVLLLARVTAMLTEAEAVERCGGARPCSGINDVWFAWEEAS